MAFQVRTETRQTIPGQDGTVFVLEDGPGGTRAEIWPAAGFNCYLWQVAHGGTAHDLLYADPQFFQGSKPTRTGIPILFPFPNRIRAGRFSWAGREYQLPLNDSDGKNAIHGFACRRPWRVIGQGAGASAAWVTGEFRGSHDAPDARDLWPADYLIRVTHRLEAHTLRILTDVENPNHTPLPFGLGFHPYFHIPPLQGEKAEDFRVQATPDRFWVLQDSLPTGQVLPVDASRDLRRPRRFAELTLDDVLRGPNEGTSPGLIPQGALWHSGSGAESLRVESSPAFRELVVFTPAHRQAVCLEPYTCTTDAINLEPGGIDAGLRVLQPGEEWQGEVVLTFVPPTTSA
jgi:aldose 1-epimerase